MWESQTPTGRSEATTLKIQVYRLHWGETFKNCSKSAFPKCLLWTESETWVQRMGLGLIWVEAVMKCCAGSCKQKYTRVCFFKHTDYRYLVTEFSQTVISQFWGIRKMFNSNSKMCLKSRGKEVPILHPNNYQLDAWKLPSVTRCETKNY